MTVVLSVPLGPANLLIVAALLLEGAVLCAHRLESAAARLGSETAVPARPAGLGGGWLSGIAMLLRSPYLAGVALWVAALSVAGTFLYFQQLNIVAAASDDRRSALASSPPSTSPSECSRCWCSALRPAG